MRYFAKENADSSLQDLFRMAIGDEGFVQQYWTEDGWHRDDFAEIVSYLALGEGDLTEISEVQARSHLPAAFESPNAQTVVQHSSIPLMHERASATLSYRVLYFGSSLVGVSFGFQSFEKARTFLQGKSDKGSAKCFHWWCSKCKEQPFAKGDSPVDHVISVSIPNVLAISQGEQVRWFWHDPESDWVKSRTNTPEQEFHSLVDRKSRPNWKVLIQPYLQ